MPPVPAVVNTTCNCHGKHQKAISDIEKSLDKNDETHKEAFALIRSKLDAKWLLAAVPLFIVWMGFQMTLFNAIKNIEKDVAVISQKVKAIEGECNLDKSNREEYKGRFRR